MPSVPTRRAEPQQRRVTVFGAYAPCGPQAGDPRTGGASTARTGTLTAEIFLDFLWRQVGGLATPLGEVPPGFARERPCCVVLDNGSVHTSRLVKDHRPALAAAGIKEVAPYPAGLDVDLVPCHLGSALPSLRDRGCPVSRGAGYPRAGVVS